MHIDAIIAAAPGPTFSFEFSPPKTDEGEATLRATLRDLSLLEPDFVSVTYGAGGSTRDRTLGVTRWIKQELGIEAMAHLTCVSASAADLRGTLDQITAAGIDNVLALRGDTPGGGPWQTHPGGFDHAAELATLIRSEYGFCVGGACYPELHQQSPDLASEIHFLKQKVGAGAAFLVTQLFFDNDAYFRFVDAARAAGIEVPILPGIMPITNAKQVKRMSELSGASMPPALIAELDARAEDPVAATELGVSYASLQCAELLARGAPGIHFYTLNRSQATRAILTSLRIHRPWETAAAVQPSLPTASV